MGNTFTPEKGATVEANVVHPGKDWRLGVVRWVGKDRVGNEWVGIEFTGPVPGGHSGNGGPGLNHFTCSPGCGRYIGPGRCRPECQRKLDEETGPVRELRSGNEPEESMIPQEKEELNLKCGPPLSETMRKAGLNTEKCNIAIIGTKHAGKSTLKSLVLGMHPSQQMHSQAWWTNKEWSETEKRDIEALDCQSQIPTTWEMVEAGKCSTAIEVLIPGGVLWDLPARVENPEVYFAKAALNDFDAVVLVSENSLSNEDCELLLYLHSARLANQLKPVPVYLVRSHLDKKVQQSFHDYTSAEGSSVGWCLEWPAITSEARMETLRNVKGFEASNSSSSTSTSGCTEDRFYFSGLVEEVRGNDEFPVPRQELKRLASHLACELAHVRKELWDLGSCKQMMMGLCPASSAAAPMPLAAMKNIDKGLMQDALSKLEKRVDIKYAVIHQLKGEKLGFGLELSGDGKLIIRDLEADSKLMEQYGLRDGDEVLEVPLGFPFKVAALGKVAGKSTAEVTKAFNRWFSNKVEQLPLQIAIARPPAREEDEDENENEEVVEADARTRSVRKEERTFAGSEFKRQYTLGIRGVTLVTLEDYDRAVQSLALEYAAKHLIRGREAVRFVKQMKELRPSGESLNEIATCDWSTAIELGGASQFCNIVNWALREDASPAIDHVAVILRGLNLMIVRSIGRSVRPTGGTRGGGQPLAWPPERSEEGLAVSFRGGAIPADAVAFFHQGKKYRTPMVLATSFSRSTAKIFQTASQEKRPSARKVMWLFHFDTVKGCRHVQYIEKYTACPSEEEFLLAPYSCFKVIDVLENLDHTEIHLYVYPDNKEDASPEMVGSEVWPLALWH